MICGTIDISSFEDMKKFAGEFAKSLNQGDIIALRGELGSGKTTFAKYVIHNITGHNLDAINSPTFNMVNIYNNIYHYDLYRLKTASEIWNLSIEDAISEENIVFIEWPDIIESILPKNILRLEFRLDGAKRCLVVGNEIS